MLYLLDQKSRKFCISNIFEEISCIFDVLRSLFMEKVYGSRRNIWMAIPIEIWVI